MFWLGTACTIIVGSISSIGAQGSLLSVEKEWTTALCEEDSTALAQLNAGADIFSYAHATLHSGPECCSQLH